MDAGEVLQAQGAVNAMSVLGPRDVWVFSSLGKIYHFNGRTWTEVPATLQGGSALNGHNVWAYGGADVEHCNGRTWTATNVASLLPPPTVWGPASLTSILALAPDDVYATGEGPEPPDSGGPGVLLHFNGRTWTRVAESSSLNSASGTKLVPDGRGGLWISAEPTFVNEGLFHYSAGQLTAVTLPSGVNHYGPVSHIPGTAGALFGAETSNGTPSGASLILRYSLARSGR